MWCSSLLLIASAVAQIPQIEREALEYRRAISSGEIVIDSTFERRRSRDAEMTNHWKFHIWWDGQALRQDEMMESSGKVVRDIANSWFADRYYRWDRTPATASGRIVAVLANGIDQPSQGAEKRMNIIALGVIPCAAAMLKHETLDAFLTNPDRVSAKTQEVALDGIGCILVSIKRPNGLLAQYWIDPRRGNSVIKAQTQFSHGPESYSNEIKMELALHEPSGIWFPKRYAYARSVNNVLVEQEDGAISIVSLNEPIPPDVFTFSGMGLPVGWPVSDLTRADLAGDMAWDGKQVVSTTRAERAVASQSRTNKVYVILAVILAAVAGLLFWRFLSPRTAAK